MGVVHRKICISTLGPYTLPQVDMHIPLYKLHIQNLSVSNPYVSHGTQIATRDMTVTEHSMVIKQTLTRAYLFILL